jgi:hypothetical protein
MALLSSVESAPRAYRLKASNAASPISTSIGTMPGEVARVSRCSQSAGGGADTNFAPRFLCASCEVPRQALMCERALFCWRARQEALAAAPLPIALSSHPILLIPPATAPRDGQLIRIMRVPPASPPAAAP